MMRTSPPAAKQRDGQSAWAPLANPMFRALWVAAMAATHLSVPEALQIAAAGLALSVLATWRIKLVQLEGGDLAPSMHWPAPVVDKELAFDRGPVLVTLAYPVDPAHLSAFLRLMEQQRVARRRDGALY